METSVITKTNALKAAQFLLNLDASYLSERYRKFAFDWVQNLIKAKCVLEQSQFVNPEQCDLTKPMLENKLVELANNAKDLSKMLLPEAQEKLISYLMLSHAI